MDSYTGSHRSKARRAFVACAVVLALFAGHPAYARGGHSGGHTASSAHTGSSHAQHSKPTGEHANKTSSAGAANQAGHHVESLAAQGAVRDTHGKIARSGAVKGQFKKSHPCPSTGKSSGACPGYVIDHRIALKRGGADRPDNMQWQTKAEAKAKDRAE